MPILYVFENSGNCEKIITILRILNIPYEKVVLDRDKIPDDFVLKSPLKKVPVFEDNGTVYLESMSILFYLAQGTHLMPKNQVNLLKWFSFEQSEIQQTIAVARYKIKFQFQFQQEDVLQARGYRALQIIEEHLKHFPFFEGTFSICDIAMAAYLRLAEEAHMDLKGFPEIINWLKRIDYEIK